MVIRSVSKRRIPLFGKMIARGETREIHPQQWGVVERDYPGQFEQVGGAPPSVPPQGGDVAPGERMAGLDALGLSLRALEALEGAGVTVAGLGEMSDEDLLAISGIGLGTLREIRAALAVLRQTQDEGDNDGATD